MLNSSYDKTGLNLKFIRAFVLVLENIVLVLENILGPSVVTHYNGNSTTYYMIITHNGIQKAEWS